MKRPTNHAELMAQLQGDRARILDALREEGKLASSTLRKLAEIPPGSKHYQFSTLESWGLIEQVGTLDPEQEGRFSENVYAITADGRSAIRDFRDDGRAVTTEEEIDNIQSDIDQLQTKLYNIENGYEELWDAHRDLRNDHEDLSGRVDEVIRRMKNDFREWVIEQIERRAD